MPATERDRLPVHLQPFVEQRIKGQGFFGVYCAGLPGSETVEADKTKRRHGYEYEARVNGKAYRAFVFGKWRDQTTVSDVEIEGVALGDSIVIGDSPTPAEQGPNDRTPGPYIPTTAGPNTLLYMIARFSDQIVDPIDEATALTQLGVVSNFWMNNSGGKVYIHGLVNSNLAADVVHISLPQPISYATSYNTNFGQLLSDARTAAAAVGYYYTNYNLDVVITTGPGFSYAGRSYVGSQGSHWVTPNTTLRTAGHELGHNLGLYHANYWRTDSTQPFGKDSNPGGYVADISDGEWLEYGHYFSVMGAQSGSDWDDATKPHYNPVEKVQLGWLSGNQVQYVTTNGTYRLFRHDARSTVGNPRGIRIETPATDYSGYARRYWLSYRYASWSAASNWYQNGVAVDVAQTSYGSDGSTLLDMTPYSRDQASPFYNPFSPPGGWWAIDNSDKLDGALAVGRTYDDASAGIHITPIATGNNGVGEEYIDLVINLGAFAGNHTPVITALNATTNQAAVGDVVSLTVSAADPDGDTLAYSWDFGEVQVWARSGLNSPTAAKSWSNEGQYRITIRVTDMKGGIATASEIVTVGTPTNNAQIWGRVVSAGQPVYGARISTTAGDQVWTDSDGSYVLGNLIVGGSYTVNCQAVGLTFTAQFSNPVSLAWGNTFGIDFYANQNWSGAASNGTMVISPYQGQMANGQTLGFRADAWDASGNRITVSPVWSVSGGGAVDNTGVFSATSAGGPYTVTAVAGLLSATGSVWVSASGTSGIPPTITTQPLSQAVAAGSNVTFSVVTGPEAAGLSYHWQFNGADIASATLSSYTRTNAQSADAGNYSVVVTNLAGSTNSDVAVLMVNNPPVLSAISDQTIHAGSTLILTNQATDLDVPPQILTFSIDPGARAGASIDASNGLFVWSSTVAQAGTTNPVTIRVTDNGNPILSDAKSFLIYVAPPLTINSISTSNGTIMISWNAIPGKNYRVLYADQLDGQWNQLGSDISANSPISSATDVVTVSQRFYRVMPVD